MDEWTVYYHRNLGKEIRRLPKKYVGRLLETIEALATNPHPAGSIKVQGHDLWRVKVGVYRIIYHIDDENQIINTYRIGHRRNVYRNL